MIENLIIDFGGVIAQTDVKAAIVAFSKYSAKPELMANLTEKQLEVNIEDYERGIISSEQFYKNMSEAYLLDCTYSEFSAAWLKVIVGVYDYSHQAIQRLKKNYNLILLSNTSELHYQHFEPLAAEIFAQFDKLYFSHLLGMRKPKPEIYQHVVSDAGIRFDNTIFADDLMSNLLPFKQLGGEIVQILPEFTLLDFSKKI